MPSIKKTVPFAFLIPLLTCVGLLGWIASHNGHRMAENFSKLTMKQLGEQIKEGLNKYLNTPQAINKMNAELLGYDELNIIRQPEKIEQHFHHQMQAFKNVDGIQFGFAQNGQLRGIVREKTNKEEVLTYNIADRSTNMANTIYQVTNSGKRGKEIERKPNYDARKRAWYQTAQKLGKPTWTKIFGKKTVHSTQLRISAVEPVYEKDSKKLLGVLAVDFFLTQISAFLRELQQEQSSNRFDISIFIVDRNGELVATSTNTPVFFESKEKQEDVNRIKASNSQEPWIKASAIAVEKQEGSFSKMSQQEKPLSFWLNGEQRLVYTIPFKEEGLDWLVMIVVPEQEFMENVHDTRKKTALLGVGAFGLSVLVGLFVARWLINPILQMNEVAQQIKSDKFDSDALASVAKRSDEIGQLARVLQEMVDVIYTREKSLKDRVQQLLNETDKAKKAALAKQIAGNVNVQALLAHSQAVRQKVESQKQDI